MADALAETMGDPKDLKLTSSKGALAMNDQIYSVLALKEHFSRALELQSVGEKASRVVVLKLGICATKRLPMQARSLGTYGVQTLILDQRNYLYNSAMLTYHAWK